MTSKHWLIFSVLFLLLWIPRSEAADDDFIGDVVSPGSTLELSFDGVVAKPDETYLLFRDGHVVQDFDFGPVLAENDRTSRGKIHCKVYLNPAESLENRTIRGKIVVTLTGSPYLDDEGDEVTIDVNSKSIKKIGCTDLFQRQGEKNESTSGQSGRISLSDFHRAMGSYARITVPSLPNVEVTP